MKNEWFRVKRRREDSGNKNQLQEVSEENLGIRINGFFGMFDILGFQSLIKNSTLDQLVELYRSVLSGIEREAITLRYSDEEQTLSLDKVGSFMFSDTIILYQELPLSGLPVGGSFMLKAALLLRLAFEKGLPLRGAISYGDYYVERNCFIGRPIVEAYEIEKSQDWSGAVLCPSAEAEYERDLKNKRSTKRIDFHGIEINPAELLSPFMNNLIIECDVPTKEGPNRKQALCWDDYVPMFCGINVPKLVLENLTERVHASFSDHNKDISNREVQKKIKNTISFLRFSSKRVIKTRLVSRGDHP